VQHVHLELLLPRFFAFIDRECRNIGDDDIDALQLLGTGSYPSLERIFVADIDGLAETLTAFLGQSRDGRIDFRLVARTDRDIGAFIGKDIGGAPADAFRSPGHQGIQPLQAQIHDRSPFS
jgi:hypothetical protein